MALYQPTYRSGSVEAPRLDLANVGAIGQAVVDVARQNDERRRLDLAEKRQAEQDDMRKAEYDLRMKEAQRVISQRDLLNTVGRESARQVQPHLLAQNKPLLERLNTGTVEGWKAYEQEVAGKDAEVADLLARRDAYAKDRAAGVGEAQFSNEESDLLRSKILGYKTKGGDTVQSLATGAYESYVPVKEDASDFMMSRLSDAGVDIDIASNYVNRATEGYKDRATLTAEGSAARDAAIKADEARVKNELDKAKILADVNKDYSGVLGRTISQGMSVDPETGMITGVRRSGAKKGEPFSISAKDTTVYDVLESYSDYVGNDSDAKKSINTLLDEKYSKVPENIKAAAVKHSIEDASGMFGNKVDVNTNRLQATLDNYLEKYSRTGEAPSFESGVLNKAEVVKDQLIKRIEAIKPRSDIPMAMTAEQVRDSAPLNRLKAFLGNTRAPERVVQQPVSGTNSSAPKNKAEAKLEKGLIGLDLEKEFAETNKEFLEAERMLNGPVVQESPQVVQESSVRTPDAYGRQVMRDREAIIRFIDRNLEQGAKNREALLNRLMNLEGPELRMPYARNLVNSPTRLPYARNLINRPVEE